MGVEGEQPVTRQRAGEGGRGHVGGEAVPTLELPRDVAVVVLATGERNDFLGHFRNLLFNLKNINCFCAV